MIDPNDPKGKQQAIHKAESFADYLAKRNAAPAPAAPSPVAPAAPAPVAAPVADPVASSFTPTDTQGETRFGEAGSRINQRANRAAVTAPTAPADSYANNAEVLAAFNHVWCVEAKAIVLERWDPESPRTYENFNPFERNDENRLCDTAGCFPGQSRGYRSPLLPRSSFAEMQADKVKMEEIAKHPKFDLKGKPGCFSLGWQDNLGVPPINHP